MLQEIWRLGGNQAIALLGGFLFGHFLGCFSSGGHCAEFLAALRAQK